VDYLPGNCQVVLLASLTFGSSWLTTKLTAAPLIYVELHNLYGSTGIIRTIKSRRMKWAGHVARMGAKRNACRILVGKPEGKRPLGRPRCKWEDNIKMDFRDKGWGGMGWIELVQDRDQWGLL
jgi:hypothetical protein